MRSNTPLFSSFMKLKYTNPDAYHRASTIREMISLQREHGAKFYELPHTKRGNE